jgi:uncharacterized cupredoxin-like copper-binding protein
MKLNLKSITLPVVIIAALAAVSARTASAHGDAAHKKAGPVVKEQRAFGIAGDAKAVNKTITFSMTDAMRFEPDRITVKQGETIRFVLINHGKQMHEFVLGTKEELDEHAALMQKFPNMEHDEPHMAHVQPGMTGTVIWTFNRAGKFDFACLIAGHYEAGMVGKVTVAAK